MLRTLFISLCILISLSAAADTITGQCGKNLYWSFDSETGHLDITGSGKMNLTTHPAWTKKNIIIRSVTFPDSITSIDSYAFEEQELTEIVIPASVEKFGRDAFVNMPSLLRFTYERIGYAETENGILRNCNHLHYFQGISKMMYYNDALDTIIITYGAANNNLWGPTYINNRKAYDIRLNGKYSEDTKSVKTYYFPDELEKIGDFYLCNATELLSISIPQKVTEIGKGAFLNCSAMDSVVFEGMGIQTIADSAFCNCNNIAYIRLQDTIPPIIYPQTFEGVDRSIPIYIPENTLERYQTAPYWSEFFNYIQPELPTHTEQVYQDIETNKNTDFIGKKILKKQQVVILFNGEEYNIQGSKL